jgi:hypothetical protein
MLNPMILSFALQVAGMDDEGGYEEPEGSALLQNLMNQPHLQQVASSISTILPGFTV